MELAGRRRRIRNKCDRNGTGKSLLWDVWNEMEIVIRWNNGLRKAKTRHPASDWSSIKTNANLDRARSVQRNVEESHRL
jgi:hypothetical protein